jgi:hypothetical protein
MDKLLFWLGIGAAQKGAVEANQASALGSVAAYRYSVSGVDSCRNVYSAVSQKL